jgi:hypothetical protein
MVEEEKTIQHMVMERNLEPGGGGGGCLTKAGIISYGSHQEAGIKSGLKLQESQRKAASQLRQYPIQQYCI